MTTKTDFANAGSPARVPAPPGTSPAAGCPSVSQDWFSNIQNLPKSRLLYNIKGHLFYNTAFAFSVSMVHLLTPQHVIDDLHVSVGIGKTNHYYLTTTTVSGGGYYRPCLSFHMSKK